MTNHEEDVQVDEFMNQSHEDEVNHSYYDMKNNDHQELNQWILSAEQELADLRLRKRLLEADFSSLLEEYRTLIIQNAEISTIAKTNLLEYFSYELLKPLETINLQQADSYNTWSTKHFLVAYQLNNDQSLSFNFKMDVIDARFDAPYMPLIVVNPKEMTVEVDEKQVLDLIYLWHNEKIFSRSQLSLINFDLNQLLAWFKELGFTVKPSLLDNTHALAIDFESELPLETTVLDQIFITTMESEEYDFEKIAENHYQVQLNQEQKVDIYTGDETVRLFINSNERRRSILDFFTHYPFLVPLIVRT